MNASLNRLIACLTVAMLPGLGSAEAEVPHYRVEIIAFTHTAGASDARLQTELEDYTSLIDPLARARRQQAAETEEERSPDDPEWLDRVDPEETAPVVDQPEQEREADIEAVLELIDTLADLESGELMPELPTWPETYLALESPSGTMARALQRLNDSSEYQVLTWRAWHQPLSRSLPGKRVRMHDEQVVAARWGGSGPGGLPAGADAQSLIPGFDYRLDGSIRLRQRQFMHFDADLVWRQPHQASPWMSVSQLAPEPSNAFAVHRLQQSRAVRPGRLEYFDSEWLGVLVLIEEIKPLDGSNDSDGD
ncbi:hypothetical protein IC757_08610 [Wenzhouxiangella sp. AB-CW3]|uniref:CsiV family protein n=1 Tax=Wenzhouxiangella sp. AB-CW3 TaxID=2771012 RepID=UPI00168BF7ED|nr:CsiV family protein [Wenzhouxiangella sp. AB-CW3]QOC21121.1 hypothetical protein IC757_08610 [Wenzhouxiangella sp. AB-CW3]